MQITKQFEVEMAHYVPNATSHRCSHSIHGHSYKIFVTLGGKKLDNAQMVYDFGLLKGTVKSFIDSMDHSVMIYKGCPQEVLDFFRKFNERYIIVPFIPSAEMMSIYIFKNIKKILTNTIMRNGEAGVTIENVEVYETRTGSAKCHETDLMMYWNNKWNVEYSNGIKEEWSDDLVSVMNDGYIYNPIVENQVEIPKVHDCYDGEFVKYNGESPKDL